jgi:hypothetical protein
VDEVLDALTHRVFAAPAQAEPRRREIARAVEAATVRRLLLAAGDPAQAPAVRAALEADLQRLGAALVRPGAADEPAERSLRAMLARDIARFIARPGAPAEGRAGTGGAPSEPPPGPPIGGWDSEDDCPWGPR